MRLRNFKSWQDTGEVRLAPITAFFGSNSSGKTSLLQSLLLLRQTTESPDRSRVLDLGGPSTLVDLGTAQDIQYRHDQENRVGIEVGWIEDSAIQVTDPVLRARKLRSTIIDSDRMGIGTSLHIDRSGIRVERTDYSLGDATFTMVRREGETSYDLTSNKYTFVRAPGRAWPLPHPARFYGFPDQVRAYFQNASFLSDLELKLEQRFGRIRYLGPLRDDPRRQYIFAGGVPGDVGRRGELSIDALIASRLAGTKVSRGRTSRNYRLPAIATEQLVAEWLKELGLIDRFTVEALDDRETVFRVSVQRRSMSTPVLLTDVGFGVSQVLPVLVLLAYAQPGDTVVLEQPEIHLHPAVQAGLADIIIETALARGVQIILESHSEHLLARLQRRIAERTLDRGLTLDVADVALYFCEVAQDSSQIRELELDLFGSIANWPKDFFGDPTQEALAMLEARAARQE
ncbi:AAA family ATPase [Microbacterium sp. C23T]